MSGLMENTFQRYCALLGYPVKHTVSPVFQNAGFQALGLPWTYLAMEVRPEYLSQAIQGCASMGFIGLNITVPHKQQAYELCDKLDSSARFLESVNTLKFEGLDARGEWRPLRNFESDTPLKIRSIGYNTDALAIIDSLNRNLDFHPEGREILILGAGGVGRVVTYQLASLRAETIYLVNRTRSKAEEVANKIQKSFPKTRVITDYPEKKSRIDLVINATSLGLKSEDPLPYNSSLFSFNSKMLAYDLIYNPPVTPFLRQAQKVGCRIANGLDMLLLQGVRSFEIWTGKKAPIEAMRKALATSMLSK